jgi:hypothetical protein
MRGSAPASLTSILDAEPADGAAASDIATGPVGTIGTKAGSAGARVSASAQSLHEIIDGAGGDAMNVGC